MPETLDDSREAEVEMRCLMKSDNITIINELRYRRFSKSRFNILLCRRRALPIVRPINALDVDKMEIEFCNGYREGDTVMYVSLFNDKDETLPLTAVIVSQWNFHWIDKNQEFEEYLLADEDLQKFSGKMIYVFEGNLRLIAWTRHIALSHSKEADWHVAVDCIVLNNHGDKNKTLRAMTKINWSKENDHVIESIPSQLWRIQTFGKFTPDDFKPLLPPEDIKLSGASNKAHLEKCKSWPRQETLL